MPNFIVDAPGPSRLSGVFEDDGETGYLYIYEPGGRGILRHLHIYDDATSLGVREQDVRVIWSSDHGRCAVVVWDGVRGVIDLRSGTEHRSVLDDYHSQPVTEPEWLSGFSLNESVE